MVGYSGPGRLSRTPEILHKNAFRLCAALLGALAVTVAVLWVSPAYALPSFAGQTGLPCSACHVGGFGPQLTPFGMYFKATGYTMGGGTGVWSNIPFNLQFEPTSTTLAKDRPTAPKGYGKNNFTTPGCASFLIAGGRLDQDKFGGGGILKVWANLSNAFVVQSGTVASLGPSDLKLVKPLTVGTHSLVLGFDLNNKATGGDPYNSLYGYNFPYIGLTNGISPAASPKITSVSGTAYGATLFALLDNAIYAQAGIYETLAADQISAIGKTPPSVGTTAGGAPYFRLAYQHAWGNNFLEVGGLAMFMTFQQIPGISNPSLQNQYSDWGLDATYQRTFGANTLAIETNFLHDQQNLNASFAAGKSTYASDDLNQFRITATYAWNSAYELTLAYSETWGSTDRKLYAPGLLTGSANGSPNSQAIIAQVDWAPWGNNTTYSGYPWLNVRVGLQYTYYLQFNGGTTNYDGFGRNASDNNAVLLFMWWSF